MLANAFTNFNKYIVVAKCYQDLLLLCVDQGCVSQVHRQPNMVVYQQRSTIQVFPKTIVPMSFSICKLV